MAEIISLPEDILTTLIFPRLSTSDIGKLCPLHSRFNNASKNENLWQRKVYDEYPQYYYVKDEESTWKEFYIYLYESWEVPIYENGDVVKWIRINHVNINEAIYEFIDYPLTVTFADKRNNPIISIRYPQAEIQFHKTPNYIKAYGYGHIAKIIRFKGNSFEISTKEVEDNLKSPLSKIPVWGIIGKDGHLTIVTLNRNFTENEISSLLNIKELSEENVCKALKKIGHILLDQS